MLQKFKMIGYGLATIALFRVGTGIGFIKYGIGWDKIMDILEFLLLDPFYTLFYIKVVNILMVIILTTTILLILLLLYRRRPLTITFVFLFISLILMFVLFLYLDIYMLKAMPLCGNNLTVIKLEEQVYRIYRRCFVIFLLLSVTKFVDLILIRLHRGWHNQYFIKRLIRIFLVILIVLLSVILVILLITFYDTILSTIMIWKPFFIGEEIGVVQVMLGLVVIGVYVLGVSIMMLFKQFNIIIGDMANKNNRN